MLMAGARWWGVLRRLVAEAGQGTCADGGRLLVGRLCAVGGAVCNCEARGAVQGGPAMVRSLGGRSKHRVAWAGQGSGRLGHAPAWPLATPAGCPAAVANLWDVTDRDIDRFSQALLSTWLGGDGGGTGAGGSRRGAAAAGSGGGAPTPGLVDVAAAVAGSRAACRLPHLIGAAPVCYGLPTSVALRADGGGNGGST